jgi:RHS repeat-associated protein
MRKFGMLVGGAATAQYVWSPVYVDALVLRDRDADGQGGNGLEERLWAQQDANYNVTALFDNSGNVVERYAYDPYGEVTVYDAGWNVRGGSSYGWSHLHQGLRRDAATGLDHARHREYHPALGRPLQRDPIGFDAGDPNVYRWVGNSPAGRVDPYGLDWIAVPMPPPMVGIDRRLGVAIGGGGSGIITGIWPYLYESLVRSPELDDQLYDVQGRLLAGRRDWLADIANPNYALWGANGSTTAGSARGAAFDPNFNARLGTAQRNASNLATWYVHGATMVQPTAAGANAGLQLWGAGWVGWGAAHGAGRAAASGNSSGFGIFGWSKPGGTVDNSMRPAYMQFANSPAFAQTLDRYNKIAPHLGMPRAASVDQIVTALMRDTTFSHTTNLRAGIFTPGEHPANTLFWIQGNPGTWYGPRAGRHELLHLGASLNGQGNTLRHELLVAALTTPETLEALKKPHHL